MCKMMKFLEIGKTLHKALYKHRKIEYNVANRMVFYKKDIENYELFSKIFHSFFGICPGFSNWIRGISCSRSFHSFAMLWWLC